MGQFHVHVLNGGQWVVDIQSDQVSGLRTTVVIPLVPLDDDTISMGRLNPVLSVAGERRILATQLLSVVYKSTLGPSIDWRRDDEYTIKAALDMLISGF